MNDDWSNLYDDDHWRRRNWVDAQWTTHYSASGLHRPNPEFEAYWASLSTADKIRGAVSSILAGGSVSGLLGYLIMS